MEGATGSTVPRRQLGRYLRDLRGQARFTVRAAAAALEWSEAKIWRIETGQTSMRSLDVEQMCRVYGAPADLTASLMALAKETKAKGWWLSYGDAINEGFDVYLGLEEAAEHLRWYEAELVPGLLQTPDYARTLIAGDNPGMEDEEVERRVQLRIQRQALIQRTMGAPTLHVVLNESVLRRPVGGSLVMADQLTRLVEVSEMNNVAVRVMPFQVGMHPGILSGPFVLLEFPVNGQGQPTEPRTVYVDGFTGALFLDKAHEIKRYEGAWQTLWDKAMSERETKALISRQVKELRK